MTDHERMQQQVVLAASGALTQAETVEVMDHMRGCEACRLEFEMWGTYGRGLRQLPQPTVPADLIARTQSRILQIHDEEKSQRWTSVMFLALTAFSWLITFSMWTLTRTVTGGVIELFGVNLLDAGPWFLTSFVATGITAGSAALMVSRHREARRVL